MCNIFCLQLRTPSHIFSPTSIIVPEHPDRELIFEDHEALVLGFEPVPQLGTHPPRHQGHQY